MPEQDRGRGSRVRARVLEMQRLAECGKGLNIYINKYIRHDYAQRLD